MQILRVYLLRRNWAKRIIDRWIDRQTDKQADSHNYALPKTFVCGVYKNGLKMDILEITRNSLEPRNAPQMPIVYKRQNL